MAKKRKEAQGSKKRVPAVRCKSVKRICKEGTMLNTAVDSILSMTAKIVFPEELKPFMCHKKVKRLTSPTGQRCVRTVSLRGVNLALKLGPNLLMHKLCDGQTYGHYRQWTCKD